MLNTFSYTKFKISKVIVLGGLSGRFDHVLSSLNSILQFDSCEITIIDGVNLVTILREVYKFYSHRHIMHENWIYDRILT